METIKIKALLEHIIFQNEQTHYVVGSFSETETYHYFVAAGTLMDPLEDQEYELAGQYTNHPKYGLQFQIQNAIKMLPKFKDSIIRFLSSADFPTIGTKTAQLIYDTLGEDCLDIIKESPERLDEVPGLNKKKKQILRDGIQAFDQHSDFFYQCMEYGLDQNKILLLEQNYADPQKVLQEDCFRPYYEIYGFGYRSALKLANGLQLEPTDRRRFDAFIYETLRQLTMASGNTFIHFVTLANQCSAYSTQVLEESLERLKNISDFELVEDRIYVFGLYQEEKEIARLLKEHQFPVETIQEQDLSHELDQVEFRFGITYDTQQKNAIETFFKSSISLLNGGPGTGKTTTVKAILELIRTFYANANIQLCAPTGRASKRLSDLSYGDSKTIHSLLKWNKEDNTFGKNEDELLDIDFLIVDEFSMVDTHLFCSLLKALPCKTRILLIGDEDQLESVGPGKVFQDLIETKIFPITHLEKIFRQKNGSGIVTLAREIRKEEACHYQDGVSFVEKETIDILPELQKITADLDVDRFQVLSCMYKGSIGIDAINQTLQEQFNPFDSEKHEIKVGTTIFREEDKVMLLKNLPEEDVYNGDIGSIIEIKSGKNEKCISVDFGNRIVDFTTDFLYYLKHAYCISVHKSQGSEYDTVIVVVDRTNIHMLNKRLLYTAISRAKKCLYILGQKSVFEKQIRLKERRIRQTTLQAQILDIQKTKNS